MPALLQKSREPVKLLNRYNSLLETIAIDFEYFGGANVCGISQ